MNDPNIQVNTTPITNTPADALVPAPERASMIENAQMVNPISAGLESADKLGEWMAKSGMFGCKSVDQAKVMAMTCIVEKITPMQFANTYDVIQGKVCMKSQAMMAKFISAGGDFEVIERTGERCEINFTWRERVTNFVFTLEEAKLLGVVKAGSNWEKAPANMLYARCTSNYLRTYVPELFAGHYLAEEVNHNVPAPPRTQAKPLLGQPKQKAGDPNKSTNNNDNPKPTIEAEVVEVAEQDTPTQTTKPAPKRKKATADADKPKDTPAPKPAKAQTLLQALTDADVDLANTAKFLCGKCGYVKPVDGDTPEQTIARVSAKHVKLILGGFDGFVEKVKEMGE